MDALVERLGVLEETVKELVERYGCSRGYVIKAVLKNSRNIMGYRQIVYRYAELDCGFYTCEDHNTSIGYGGDDGKDLIVNIAFLSKENAARFANKLRELSFHSNDKDMLTSLEIIEDDNERNLSALISRTHYKPEDSSSPRKHYTDNGFYHPVFGRWN